MTTFKSITIQGTTYTFDHLSQMTVNIDVKSGDGKRTFSILVNFTCHCFTDQLDLDLHTPDYHYNHDGEKRAFSHIRYKHSLGLPGIIQAIANKRVYFTNQDKYVIIETVDESGELCPYTIFFNMKKGVRGQANVVMTVASAYIKPDMTKKASTIRFHTLVSKIVRGQRPMPDRLHQDIRQKRK